MGQAPSNAPMTDGSPGLLQCRIGFVVVCLGLGFVAYALAGCAKNPAQHGAA